MKSLGKMYLAMMIFSSAVMARDMGITELNHSMSEAPGAGITTISGYGTAPTFSAPSSSSTTIFSGMGLSPSAVNVTPCLGGDPLKAPAIGQLTKGVMYASGTMACKESRKYLINRYGQQECKLAVLCSKHLMEGDAETNKMWKAPAASIVAKDHIKNTLIMNGDKMEQLEVVRSFAQKKFKKEFEEKCPASFKEAGKQQDCNMQLINAAFDSYQLSCKNSESGCYDTTNKENGVLSYNDFKKDTKTSVMKGITSKYFTHRVESASEYYADHDLDKSEKIFDEINNSTFAKLSADKKLEYFLKEVGFDSQGRLKDPILSYDLGTLNTNTPKLKSSAQKEELIKLLTMKDLNKKSFVKAFDDYREKRTSEILNPEATCKDSNSLSRLCYEATRMAVGGHLKKDPNALEQLASRNMSTTEDSDLLKMTFGNDVQEKDYDTLINARRCVSYSIVSENGDSVNNDPVDYNPREGTYSTPLASIGSARRSDSSLDDYKATSGAADIASSVSGPVKEASSENLNNFTNTAAQPLASNDMYTNAAYNSFAGSDDLKSPTGEKSLGDESSSKASEAVRSQDKMNDYLMKKLAAAEENLEKLKADNLAADADRERQKKIDEETATIKDLKKQVSDLKNQSIATSAAKKTAAAENYADQSRSQGYNSAVSSYNNSPVASSSRGDSGSSSKASSSSDRYDSSRGSEGNSESSGGSSGSRGNGPTLTAVSAPEGSKSVSTTDTGEVIISLDGLAPADYDKKLATSLLAANGEPIYIEERGVVKIIYPEMEDGKVKLDKDGNPIYTKLVKGKKGKKLANGKESRVPASLKSAADLKMSDEETHKRDAFYGNLRDITSGALLKTK